VTIGPAGGNLAPRRRSSTSSGLRRSRYVFVRSEAGAGTTFTIILPGPESVEDTEATRSPRPGAPAQAA
jgi:hypothetical protein